MSWRTLFLEINLPGELCSGLIICWRKIAGEMSPGEKFLGEKCDEFLRVSCHYKQGRSHTMGRGAVPPVFG